MEPALSKAVLSKRSREHAATPAQNAAAEALKRHRGDSLDATILRAPRQGSSFSREIRADVEYFLKPDVLGFHMSQTGKAAVMAAANNGLVPRFSKYCGNDA